MNEYPGAVPRGPMPEVGTGAHFQQGGGGEGSNGGPRTWQVMVGFLSAAAIIVGGTWTLVHSVFLDKETYLREQREQIELNAELKAAVKENITAAQRLEEKLTEVRASVNQLNLQLARSSDRDRR